MNTYLIYGNDYGLIKREIDKIINGIIDVVKYDLSASNVSEVIEEASCMSLFGDKKAVIGENALFLTGTNTSVNHDIDYLTSYVNAENHDNIVILTVVQDKLDERKKIVKLHENGMINLLFYVVDLAEKSGLNPDKINTFLHDFVCMYKSKELEFDYYREFSVESRFRYRFRGAEVMADQIDEQMLEKVDISYNYLHIILPLINLLV